MAVLLTGCLVNQQNLWPSDKLPPSSPNSRTPNVADVPYGTDALQTVDLHLPVVPARGVILWLHPGGWCCGDKADVDALILSTLAKGYGVVSANYRLVPDVTAEQQMADVDRVIRFVKASRVSWGLGAGKLIVAGGSAGGNLALLAAAAPGHFAGSDLGWLSGIDPRVDAVISLVGPSNLRSYIDGEIEGWGQGLAEGFLGCSDLGSQWPTTTTTTVATTTTSSPSSPSSSSTTVVGSQSVAALARIEPSIDPDSILRPAVAMPRCDPARVLRFSPMFWAAFTVLFGGRQLPPAYFAYGNQDWLVPPASQGAPLHDWWAAGGNWLATYYDNPPSGGHNLSFDVNATAFSLWLSAFASP